MVKRLPAMWEIRVQSKEMATPSEFLPGESHGQRSMVGCSPWGHKESDTTERLHFTSLSAIGMVSSAYLGLLIFLPAGLS